AIAAARRKSVYYGWLIRAVGTAGIGKAEVGQYRLAGNRCLAFRDQCRGALGQIDVEPRAEADQAKTLAGADRLPFPDEADDAARHQPCDLDHPDAPVRRSDDERVAFIVLARLVELGIDENAGPVGDAFDLAGDWRAVHMTIEHAHEDRDARQRPVARPKFRW